ncbi:MAG: methyltransferase domain-containing protein [Deinococcales bacterium]|nr:methyltransferase domain-containing protein [Chitinophagaceae bacterium]
MTFKQRSYKAELLDGDGIAFTDIKQNMQELDTINTLLGGHAITIKGIAKLVGNLKQITVCEIGCGGGDNLIAINNYCTLQNIQAQFIGIDIKQTCISFAKTKPALQHNTTWLVSDYQQVVFKTQPTIIFSSLFCHHFTNQQLVFQLLWMQKNASVGFFINDLQRHFLAYYSIKIITQIFSSSYLVKNDAPLSVARGFVKNDWVDILNNAHLNNYQITWQWAFRFLIIYKH